MPLFDHFDIIAPLYDIVFKIQEPENLIGYFPDLIQVPYNLLDDRFEQFMIDLHGKGCEIHTRSTLILLS